MDAGQRLGHYLLQNEIGRGGMGIVWKAIDVRLERSVAVKILPPHLAAEPTRRQRLEREAKVIARLNHPHICVIHDVGQAVGVDFIVMEYLDGESLAARLRQGPLSVTAAVQAGIQIADALQDAHAAGVVHRDLKPANVMLTRRGVKLLDFGLAKVHPALSSADDSSQTRMAGDGPLTDVGTVFGTLGYMAPEQLEGRAADERADIYALGVVLYEMLTARRAFPGQSAAAVMAAVLGGRSPSLKEARPGSPPFLDQLIGRCLTRDPGGRWQSAGEVVGELRWIAGAPAEPLSAPRARTESAGAAITYVRSSDGALIAAARSGSGPPLVVVPTMADTIEGSLPAYRQAFPDREIVLFDRRGTGLSERGLSPDTPEPYLDDVGAVVEGLGLDTFDLVGTLLGTIEAASLASRRPQRVRRLVLRAPVIGLADWAQIPAVRAALAALEEDWEFFTEAFAQLVTGWGNPQGRVLASRQRAMTSRDELRGLLRAFTKLDLGPVYAAIRAPTLVEHHPAYFFPDSYSRQIASMIDGCRLAIFSGERGQFLSDLDIPRAFLAEPA